MSPELMIAVGIAAVLLVALLGVWAWRRARRSRALRERFGPEYGQAVTELGGRRRAESALEARQRRVARLHIRALRADEAASFADRWRSVQARFVDDPRAAIDHADGLVTEVMLRRGYPMGNFEQRSADVSVDHPTVVTDYRAAHAIALKNEHREADTEELRLAMIHYRALFEDLLETREPAADTHESGGRDDRRRDEEQRRAS